MLAKKYRLCTARVQRLYKKKRVWHGTYVHIVWHRSVQKEGACFGNRWCVSVPKTVDKRAVVRNTIKRMIYAYLQNEKYNDKSQTAGILIDAIITPKKEATRSWKKIICSDGCQGVHTIVSQIQRDIAIYVAGLQAHNNRCYAGGNVTRTTQRVIPSKKHMVKQKKPVRVRLRSEIKQN